MKKLIKKNMGVDCCMCGHIFLIGLGLGIILSRPVFWAHPVRWGMGFMVAGLLVHFRPNRNKSWLWG